MRGRERNIEKKRRETGSSQKKKTINVPRCQDPLRQSATSDGMMGQGCILRSEKLGSLSLLGNAYSFRDHLTKNHTEWMADDLSLISWESLDFKKTAGKKSIFLASRSGCPSREELNI